MNRNYSDISYAESPFGTLSEFLSKTFGWMFAGLLVTFLVGIGAVTTGLIYPLITSGLFILTSIAELVLVFVLSARVQTLQPSTATGIFFAYAVLNGLNLSSIFLAYDFGSLILAFLVGAVYFGVMAVYGNVTNRDLTGWGPSSWAVWLPDRLRSGGRAVQPVWLWLRHHGPCALRRRSADLHGPDRL